MNRNCFHAPRGFPPCKSRYTLSASLFLNLIYSLISSSVAALTAGMCGADTFFPQSGHLQGISYFDGMMAPLNVEPQTVQ